MKYKTYALAVAMSVVMTCSALAQSAPFNAYSIGTLGGNCASTVGSVPYQSTAGQTVCSGSGTAGQFLSNDGAGGLTWQTMSGTGPVDSVNGATGVVVLDKADIGLGNVDNTSDADKPVSTAQQTALAGKLDLTGGTLTGTLAMTLAYPTLTMNYSGGSASGILAKKDGNNTWFEQFGHENDDHYRLYAYNAGSFVGAAIDIDNTTRVTDFAAVPTVSGAPLASASSVTAVADALPGYTSNVQGTGVAGLNGGKWFIYDSGAFTDNPTLRIDRQLTSGSGTPGNTYKALWVHANSNKDNAGSEWSFTSEQNNYSSGALNSENVAINGTIFKMDNGADETSGSWGGNFVCHDKVAIDNPTKPCIGAEIDAFFDAPGTGDANRQRVGLLISTGGALSSGAHAAYGILMGPASGSTIDRAFALSPGNFGYGFDTTQSTISGAAIAIAATQKIALDADTVGNFNRSLRFDSGLLAYQTPSGVVFTVNDTGDVAAGTVTLSNALQLARTTVAALPTCNVSADGRLFSVSDAATVGFNDILSGGGVGRVIAYCNGTNWVVH